MGVIKMNNENKHINLSAKNIKKPVIYIIGIDVQYLTDEMIE